MTPNQWELKNPKIHQKKCVVKNKVSLIQKCKYLLWAPFIYSMIIPWIFLDIFLTIYMNVCFRLYNITLVKRKDYFNYDRRFLNYLNIFEKINCLYCSYMNGLMAYSWEITGRTEKYWCPIKHSKKMKAHHSSIVDFADYWDEEGFRDKY